MHHYFLLSLLLIIGSLEAKDSGKCIRCKSDQDCILIFAHCTYQVSNQLPKCIGKIKKTVLEKDSTTFCDDPASNSLKGSSVKCQYKKCIHVESPNPGSGSLPPSVDLSKK